MHLPLASHNLLQVAGVCVCVCVCVCIYTHLILLRCAFLVRGVSHGPAMRTGNKSSRSSKYCSSKNSVGASKQANTHTISLLRSDNLLEEAKGVKTQSQIFKHCCSQLCSKKLPLSLSSTLPFPSLCLRQFRLFLSPRLLTLSDRWFPRRRE